MSYLEARAKRGRISSMKALVLLRPKGHVMERALREALARRGVVLRPIHAQPKGVADVVDRGDGTIWAVIQLNRNAELALQEVGLKPGQRTRNNEEFWVSTEAERPQTEIYQIFQMEAEQVAALTGEDPLDPRKRKRPVGAQRIRGETVDKYGVKLYDFDIDRTEPVWVVARLVGVEAMEWLANPTEGDIIDAYPSKPYTQKSGRVPPFLSLWIQRLEYPGTLPGPLGDQEASVLIALEKAEKAYSETVRKGEDAREAFERIEKLRKAASDLRTRRMRERTRLMRIAGLRHTGKTPQKDPVVLPEMAEISRQGGIKMDLGYAAAVRSLPTGARPISEIRRAAPGSLPKVVTLRGGVQVDNQWYDAPDIGNVWVYEPWSDPVEVRVRPFEQQRDADVESKYRPMTLAEKRKARLFTTRTRAVLDPIPALVTELVEKKPKKR